MASTRVGLGKISKENIGDQLRLYMRKYSVDIRSSGLQKFQR